MTKQLDKRTLTRLRKQLAAITAAAPELITAEAKRQKRINVHGGGTGTDKNRNAWCTEIAIARAVGPWDLDPFSNPRSNIVADESCMLERGDDGFGNSTDGSYRTGGVTKKATATTRVWGQPGYEFVRRAFEHYAHTRWCFLLRDDPRTAWFKRIYLASGLIVRLRKCEFEPPPGVKASSSPFPHALFYRHAEDATEAVLRRGYTVRRTPQT